MEVIGILIFWALMGGVGMAIASAKNRSLIEGFVLGGLCGCFGVLIEACLPKQMPAAPRGMRAVSCPRCNAVQNIVVGAPSYECWQCHITVSTGVAPAPMPTMAHPKDPRKTLRIVCPCCAAALMVAPTAKKFRCVKCHTVSDAPAANELGPNS
ncbi:hypothetical protein [Mycolicibacterium vaccae]|uniref:hypothetical protein n=1 Tax=Mycolicibacterium vaccae TaxID=1810 RepID=UPI003CFD512D